MVLRRYLPLPGYEARSGLIRWAATVRFAFRAIYELARARLAFAKSAPAAFVRANERIAGEARSPDAALPGDALLVRQVGYVIPRMASRVPWRADCLVQSLAAQRWLASAGVASVLKIGAERPEGEVFNAHSWLTYGDTVVTGGEVDGYEVLLG